MSTTVMLVDDHELIRQGLAKAFERDEEMAIVGQAGSVHEALAAYREAVRVMAGKGGGLRPGLTAAKATDILVVLFSAELYQSIRTGRGWSSARTKTLLHDLLSAQLLGH